VALPVLFVVALPMLFVVALPMLFVSLKKKGQEEDAQLPVRASSILKGNKKGYKCPKRRRDKSFAYKRKDNNSYPKFGIPSSFVFT
jgi:hypothetical protein